MEEKSLKANLIILPASAGSGKTFRLTIEFLKIVFQREFQKLPYFHLPLLAVTFTNKAAYEMKERFVKALFDLSTSKQQSAYYKYLKDILPDDELFVAARQVLRKILHEYQELQVSTLDHFFNRLFRVFSHELNMSPTYEIELEADEIKEYILEEFFLHQLDQSKQEFLVDLMTQAMDDNFDPISLKNDLISSLDIMFEDEVVELYGEKQQYSIEAYKALNSRLVEELSKIRKAAAELIVKLEAFLEENKENFKDKVGKADSVTTLLKGKIIDLRQQGVTSFAEISGIFDDIRLAQLKEFSFIVDSQLRETVGKKFYELVFSLYEQLILEQWYLGMRRRLPLLALLPTFLSLYHEYRRQKNFLYISDISMQILKLLEKYEVPFIYEFLDSKLNHVFIDEFQDTSYLQFRNFLPLLDNVLSNGGSVLLVGDIKQSLYRFRNGDYEIMYNLPIFHEKYHFHIPLNRITTYAPKVLHDFSAKTRWKKEALQHNYRSGKQIVEFNNVVYGAVAMEYTQNEGQISLKGVFSEVEQKPDEHKSQGWVKLVFFDETDETTIESQRTKKSRDLWLEVVKQEIERLRDRYHCHLGNIAILLPTNAAITRLSSYLRKHGIDVESPGLFQFSASPHVRLAMATWGYVVEPENKIAQKEVEIFCKKLSMAQDQLDQYFLQVDNLRNEIDVLPIDFLEKILALTVTGVPLWKVGGYFLSFLREEIFNLQSRGVVTLQGVWDWWQTKGRTKTVPSSSSPYKVKILTVHKAKGLEFPFVLLPQFASYDKRIHDEFWFTWEDDGKALPFYNKYPSFKKFDGLSGWIAELYRRYNYENTLTEIDKMAMYYVATTRAKYGMTIFVGVSGKDAQQKLEKIAQGKSMFNDKPLIKQMYQLAFRQGKPSISQRAVEFLLGDENIEFSTTHPEEHKEVLTTCAFDNLAYDFREEAEETEEVYSLQATYRGKVLHEMVQRISSLQHVEKVLRAYWTEGIIQEEDLTYIRQVLGEVLFEEDELSLVLNERSIAIKNKLFRPDKILLKGKQAIVLEFKSGKPNSVYQFQVENYARLLSSMGYQPKPKILYLTPAS